MGRRPPRNHAPAFKTKVALAAVKGDRTLAQQAGARRGGLPCPAAWPCGGFFSDFLNLGLDCHSFFGNNSRIPAHPGRFPESTRRRSRERSLRSSTSQPPRWSAARARAPTSLARGAPRSGVPVLPRFLLADADAVGRGGSGGAPGCGVPHQRPRGAPLPWEQRGMKAKPGSKRSRREASDRREGEALAASRPPGSSPGVRPAINPSKPLWGEDGWLFDIVNQARRPARRPTVPGRRYRAGRGIISACQVFVTGGRHAMVPPRCGRSSLPKDRFPRRLEAEARVVHA